MQYKLLVLIVHAVCTGSTSGVYRKKTYQLELFMKAVKKGLIRSVFVLII